MKKLLLTLILSIFIVQAHCQPALYEEGKITPRAEAAAAGSFNAVSISMMKWGVGMFIGIGLLCAFVKYSKADS